MSGNMFIGLFGPAIGVKLPDAEREKLLAQPGSGPFGPVDRPMGGYATLPADWTTRKTAAWIDKALANAPPYYSGDGINSGQTTGLGFCTIGFAANVSTDPNAGYMLGAGHCYPTGTKIYQGAGGKFMGRVEQRNIGGDSDISLVKMSNRNSTNNKAYTVYPNVYRVTGPLGVEGQFIGFQECKAAYVNGFACGTLTSISYTSPGGTEPDLTNQGLSNARQDGGESGTGIYLPYFDTNLQKTAAAAHGIVTRRHGANHESVFTRVASIPGGWNAAIRY